MNGHLTETLDKMMYDLTPRDGSIFIDAYNRRWIKEYTGTIDMGVDFRNQLFIMEYERDNGCSCEG